MEDLQYEIQLFGEDGEEEAAEPAVQEETDAPAAQDTGGEPEESFEDLIRGRYKDDFDERVQKIIGSRLRKLRQENDELQSRVQRQEESDRKTAEDLARGAEAIRALYPAYDPVCEAQNPDFCRMVRAGISPRAAYEAVHHKELLREAMEYAAKRSARQATRAMASGGVMDRQLFSVRSASGLSAPGIVAEVCDRVSVMYAGRVVESADTRAIFRNPAHPYTRGLIDSIPRPGTRGEPLRTIPGAPPRLFERNAACAYRERCPCADAACAARPGVSRIGPGHTVACHRTGGAADG